MLKNILKVPLNYLGRYINLPLALPMSIAFAVTYRCNSHCRTCNIWRDSLDANELNLPEIDCLFRSLGRSFAWITLSGGEPFLRSDLADICQIIYRNCRPSVISIPTNGSLPGTIIDCVKKILKDCSKIELIINLSIDGIGEEHDNIRGLLGNFDKAITTYKVLKNLKNQRLRIGLYTIVSNYNINSLENILYFSKQLLPDTHFFEDAQIRDEFKNQELSHIIPSKADYITFLQKLYNTKDNKKQDLLERVIHYLRRNYYSFVEKTLIFKRQIIPCFAAFASAYILPDGKVWACSSRKWLMGDLREYDFDFNKLWWSKNSQEIRRINKKEKCSCLQVNTNYMNLIHNPLYLAKLIYNFLFRVK